MSSRLKHVWVPGDAMVFHSYEKVGPTLGLIVGRSNRGYSKTVHQIYVPPHASDSLLVFHDGTFSEMTPDELNRNLHLV